MADRSPPSDEQLPGLGDDSQLAGPTGHLVAVVREAITAAQLDDRDKGMGELAVSCARAVELAQGRRDPYAVAAAARELRETLTRLRMDPASRQGNDAGNVEAWLAGLQAE